MKRKTQRGFLLITVYLLLPLLLILGGSLVAYALVDIRSAQRSTAFTQALYLAEAGIDQAIVQLGNDLTWAGGAGALETVGNYSVEVEDLGNNRFRLTSLGTNTSFPALTTHSVEAIVEVQESPLFRFAVFGDDFVTFTGNAYTNSYDSSDGSYSAGSAGSEGDAGTNGVSAGDVSLTGNAKVKGDVLVGEDGDPGSVITLTGNAAITGSQAAADEPFPMDSVSVPGGLTNQGDLSISGNTSVSLPGGTYLYDDVKVSGNGSLNFTGPAVVYLTGTMSISGNGIGTAGSVPPNLILYVSGSGAVSFTGNGAFYGAVYAPDSAVKVTGNGAFYGAAVGSTMTVTGNGGVHYDEALEEVATTGQNEVELLSWKDLS